MSWNYRPYLLLPDVEESSLICVLVFFVLLGSFSMHLYVGNPRCFWAACVSLATAGLSLEFVSERRFENLRRCSIKRAIVQRECRRKSLASGSIVSCDNRSFVAFQQ